MSESLYIFIIRHPFDTALSLQAHHGIDIQRANILWLAHNRAALRAFEHQPSEIGIWSSENGHRTLALGPQTTVYGPQSSGRLLSYRHTEKGVSYDKRDN